MINHIDYEKMGCERSKFDRIFLSLSSEFGHLSQLREEESLIQRTIDEFVEAYSKGAA